MNLSICIPTYNRSVRLIKLIDQIFSFKLDWIELVVVNDGSTDATHDFMNSIKSRKNLIYYMQKNKGRAAALKKAIELSSNQYIMIFDDDDEFFVDTFEIIMSNFLNNKKLLNNKNIAGIAFLTSDFSGNIIGKKFPKNNLITNPIKINADFKITGDKKQIIKSKLVKKYIYSIIENERRVPTSQLWSNMSNYDFIFSNDVLIKKNYLSDGMTMKINLLKMQSPQSTRRLYMTLVQNFNSKYTSYSFMFKSLILFHKYNYFSSKKIKLKINPFVNFFALIIGYILYKFDHY